MTSKGSTHKYIAGFIIGLSCASAVGYTTMQTEGGIGVLFNLPPTSHTETNGHTTSKYRLDGTNIKDKTITSAELQDNSVTGDKIKNGSITSVDIKDGSITNADLQPGSITVNNLQENSIDASKIKNGTLKQENVNPAWTFWKKQGNNAYYDDGNVGINTRFPNEKLQVNGSIKIKDGTEGKDYVLMSDADGKAKWSEKGVNLCKASGNGTGNICYGTNILQKNVSGRNNTTIGESVLKNNITGSNNTAVGNFSLLHQNTGNNNTAFGYLAGDNLKSGNHNIALGTNTNFPNPNGSYQLNIGNIITGNMSGNKQITIKGDLKASAFFYTSDKRLKENITPIKNVIQIVKKLRGVSFSWKENGRKTYGLVAQEVEKILPELVHTDASGYKSVEYGNLVAFLIEGIKSQQAEIDTLKNQVSNLQKQIDEIKKTLKK